MKKLIVLLVFFLYGSMVTAQPGWFQQTNPLGSNMLGNIKFVSANEGWILAGNGKLLHTLNGGTTWTVVTPEPTDSIRCFSDPAVSLSFINSSTGYFIGSKIVNGQPSGAVLYRTMNAGVNWSKVNIPQTDVGVLVQFVDANHGIIFIFANDFSFGGVFGTVDAGANWNLMNIPISGLPFFINENTGWVYPVNPGGSGTTSDSILKTTNSGNSWFAPWGTTNQVNIQSIYFSDESHGWIVGKSGLILKTSNGGMSWNYITNAGLNPTHVNKSVFFLNANTGWIGTKASGSQEVFVLYTNNGGSTWSKQPLPFDVSIFSINFFDQFNGGLIADYGIIYHTATGGVNVTNISGEVPESYSLGQNFPNPFNPRTKITFDLPNTDFVNIVVFDLLGREVVTLVNEELNAGSYEINWDATGYTSGVYYYKMTTGNFSETKRMVMLK